VKKGLKFLYIKHVLNEAVSFHGELKSHIIIPNLKFAYGEFLSAPPSPSGITSQRVAL